MPNTDKRHVNRRKRETAPRIVVPIAPTEEIRKNLKMSPENFSEALGLQAITYRGYIQKGHITRTIELAAECLLRQHQEPGLKSEKIFITRVIGGVVDTKPVHEFERMVMGNRTYYLLPADLDKGLKRNQPG